MCRPASIKFFPFVHGVRNNNKNLKKKFNKFVFKRFIGISLDSLRCHYTANTIRCVVVCVEAICLELKRIGYTFFGSRCLLPRLDRSLLPWLLDPRWIDPAQSFHTSPESSGFALRSFALYIGLIMDCEENQLIEQTRLCQLDELASDR